ncbi:MAG: hypothetical protein ACI81O_002383, partial [Cyclobacteriaceae bacterium]
MINLIHMKGKSPDRITRPRWRRALHNASNLAKM